MNKIIQNHKIKIVNNHHHDKIKSQQRKQLLKNCYPNKKLSPLFVNDLGLCLLQRVY